MERMEKQTAVEWLIEQLLKKSDIEYINGFNNLVEQAKAMEKEQIREAYISGADHIMDVQYNPSSYFNDEQYYNETFKSE
jgi:hypothetical protein